MTFQQQRVVLHVGTPKSGTTFLQGALWKNLALLEQQGVRPAGVRGRDMFWAAVDVRGVHDSWGLSPEQVAGTWERLCQQATSYRGTTVMSHELLAAASPAEVRTALEPLAGMDTHLLLTARDLPRQMASEWQERIKNGGSSSFKKFARRALERYDSRPPSLFWRYQSLPDIVQRWAAEMPPENVHIVVAPPADADPWALWRLVGEAVGFTTDAGELIAPSSPNTSLGTAQIKALREINKAIDGEFGRLEYTRVVKRYLAQQVLGQQQGSRPQCPEAIARRLATVSQSWVAELSGLGVRWYGDPAGLTPKVRSSAVSPDKVPEAETREALAAAIVVLLADRAAKVKPPERKLPPMPPPSPRLVRGGRRIVALVRGLRGRA